MRRINAVWAAAAAMILDCSPALAEGQPSFIVPNGSEGQTEYFRTDDTETFSGIGPDTHVLPPDGMIEKTLPNGLSYIIKENDSPSRMIEFRLIFRTGSAMETEGNRGAAHFLEHMAFGGTKHFPKRKLVEYLESLGVQYGIGINAFTGYDRTIYMFSMPSDDPENLDKALLIIKDWLTDITIDPKKVEGEKGIIQEELRSYDVGDMFYDLKIGTGKYSEGIPLGTYEDIERITPEILKDFHSRWYTLDRATVAVVGDIAPQDMERRISRILGPLKPTVSPEFTESPLEYAPGTAVKNVTDSMARSMTMELIIPHETVMRRTLGEAVEAGRDRMLVKAVSGRLYDTGRRASVSNNWYFADKDHFVVSVTGEDKEDVFGQFVDAMSELFRLSKDGFCDGEMDELRRGVKLYVPSGENSSAICDNIADEVLFGDRDVTDSVQIKYVTGELKATESEDLQRILSSWLECADASALAACTYNPLNTSGISAAEVDSLIRVAALTECDPYVYEPDEPEEEVVRTVIPAFLTEKRAFDDGMISSMKFYPNIGVTDILLDNGFRLVLRPTDDYEGMVQMQTFAPGGLSRVPEEDYAYYEGLAGYMELDGIEGIPDDVYHSVLAENGIGLLLGIEAYWHGMIASAPASSARLMFNLVYERMMHPGLDYEGFEEIRQEELENFGEESYLTKLMKQDVQRQLNMQIDSLMGNLMYGRRTAVTREDLETLSLDSLARVYRELFTNPDGMTCVVCGDFDTDELIAEAVPVFARMKRGAEPNRMGPSHFELPETTRKIEYPNANESQTLFDYIRFGQYEPSLRSGLKLKLMNNLIRNRLLTVLREQESLVYSPYSALFYTALPDRIFYMDINASVDRKNTSKVHEVLDEIIEELQRKKVSEKELNTLKQIFIVNKRGYLEEDATSNWKGYLVKQLRNQETLLELDMYESVLESIGAAELRDEFRSCFDTDRYMILSIGPF